MSPLQSNPSDEPCHAVRFYDDDSSLCRITADFVADGLAAHEPVLLIATRQHLEAIGRVLHSKSIEVSALCERREIVILDVEDTLDRFMKDGAPDPVEFRTYVGGAIHRLVAGRPHPRARAFGEMVDWLWKQGAHDSAIKLEVLWNELGKQFGFSLLCAYSLGNFYKYGAFERICAEHTHVVSETGEFTLTAACKPPNV